MTTLWSEIRYTYSILRGQMVGPRTMKEDVRKKDRQQLLDVR